MSVHIFVRMVHWQLTTGYLTWCHGLTNEILSRRGPPAYDYCVECCCDDKTPHLWDLLIILTTLIPLKCWRPGPSLDFGLYLLKLCWVCVVQFPAYTIYIYIYIYMVKRQKTCSNVFKPLPFSKSWLLFHDFCRTYRIYVGLIVRKISIKYFLFSKYYDVF